MSESSKKGKSRTPKTPKVEAPAKGPKTYVARGRPKTPDRLTVRIGVEAISALGLKRGDKVRWNGPTLEKA
jgi:hypothetical protein